MKRNEIHKPNPIEDKSTSTRFARPMKRTPILDEDGNIVGEKTEPYIFGEPLDASKVDLAYPDNLKDPNTYASVILANEGKDINPSIPTDGMSAVMEAENIVNNSKLV